MDLDLIVDRYRGPLQGLLAAWGATPQQAEELAQDVFAEAFVHRDRFRGDPADDRRIGPWLRGIAWNLFRAARRRRQLEVLDEQTTASREVSDETGEVIQALAVLPRRYRVVLWMKYLEGSSVAAIASLLEETEKAIESRLYQARKALAAALQERAVEEVSR